MTTVTLGTTEHLQLSELNAVARTRAEFIKDLADHAESAVDGAKTVEEARAIVDALGVAADALDKVA